MNIATISTITRREVRDTLSDWRIVAPILLLTFIFPQLLVAAASQVVRFVEDDNLAGRLMPFAALLVGFIPASFSLITALESFVGERERNSLESLLSMPISDSDLYIGKLCSSLLTPLVSSLIAMLVFVFLLIGFQPDLYFAAITLPRLSLLFLIVGGMALVMVTGAVVVSSHITTLRAANLMSSFILLPAALVVQLSAVLIINGRWGELWLVAAALMALAALLIRVGMATFSREEILSREQTQGSLNFRLQIADFRLGRSQSAISNLQSAIALIARRELREVLSDWRVLIPLGVLTVALPAGLVAGTSFALTFIQDPTLLGRLVPFAALLVGFVPASFALITAIESFVGERERNSLESLLSMPISDRSLYAGKLLSALLVPLGGSLLAMLVFLNLIRLIFPSLYFFAMTPGLVLQVALMICVITLLLVSGAVVISSHTGSIRAATLLASAVLVPTAVTIQLQALLFIAQRFDLIWYVMAALAVIAVALIRSGMASFNREEILSREHEELSLRQVLHTYLAFYREHRPAGTRPSEYAGLPFSARRFYSRELPALLYELRLPLACAALAALGGLLLGGALGERYRIAAFEQALAGLGQAPQPSPGLALFVFANNIRVSILSNIFSALSFGIFAFLVPAVAFGQIGFIASTLAARGGSWLALDADSPLQFVLAYVLPHGIVELPTFILSAALGLRIGAALLAPPPGFSAGQNLLWALAAFAKTWLLVLLPLIALGSLIEGMITPLIITGLYGL
ncbi:stage II sporulation protein M [Oscillochloris sp. ZM17-4]|uniref:stage II sporulation protein M n=1 Tax=Oscillochloris sp. ZM17-4 TaxID=2866714 RepID=UPI001C731901|nr:ABC transporter permease subunit [Oscillochloris sp. ZM17-4]MBX0327340.1 stage II sporulation protein M [Oscillochloris sp. ZM17-4]